jgi:hypothetical protein
VKSTGSLVSDFQSITGDSSTSSLSLAKTFFNLCIHNVLSLSDWNFNKDRKDLTTTTNTQSYDSPYNSAKIDNIYVWYGGVWYTPKEVRSGTLWRQLNYVPVYSSIPQYWHIGNRSKKVGIFPIPSDSNGTIRITYTKRIVDIGNVSDYSTGSVKSVANSSILNFSGGSISTNKLGRWFQVTDTNTVADNYWFEIDSVASSGGSVTIKQSMPVSLGSVNFRISELVPLMDGFEDLPLYFALGKYYQMREKIPISQTYEELYRNSLTSLMERDQRSVQDVFEKETLSTTPVYDVNSNPWMMGQIK